MDELIVFHALEQEHIDAIAKLMLDQVKKRLQERGVRLEIDPDAVQFLAKEGFDVQYGARPLRRAIQRMVEDALSEELLAGRVALGNHVRAALEEGKLVFQKLEETEMP